jgi:hypothetical protein
MNTNSVNAQNRAFFADLHEAFDTLEEQVGVRERALSPGHPAGQPVTRVH